MQHSLALSPLSKTRIKERGKRAQNPPLETRTSRDICESLCTYLLRPRVLRGETSKVLAPSPLFPQEAPNYCLHFDHSRRVGCVAFFRTALSFVRTEGTKYIAQNKQIVAHFGKASAQ